METRKVIQIASPPAAGPHGNERNLLFALCDDGTMWLGTESDEGWYWKAIENVPQVPMTSAKKMSSPFN